MPRRFGFDTARLLPFLRAAESFLPAVRLCLPRRLLLCWLAGGWLTAIAAADVPLPIPAPDETITPAAGHASLELAQAHPPSILDRYREPTPTPRPGADDQDRAPVVVEKPGGRDAPDEREAPRPFFWFLGGSKYLTSSIRQRIDAPGVRSGRWRYIIVHNSGTRQGNARAFDFYHRRVRHMPNGMAYHFVIGNGHGSGNGHIEIGSRWSNQLPGGHVASDYLNNIGIGICLVGDFNRDLPTKAQAEALEELINYLRKRVGRVDRQLAQVKAHREINPKPTDCPGRRFPVRWLHRKFD